MRPGLISLLLSCLTLSAASQSSMNTDSLRQLLMNSSKDTNRVLILINLGQQLEGSDPEKAKAYYLEAGTLSRELGYRLGTLKYISNYTYVLNMQGKFDSSLLLNMESVRLSREWGDSVAVAKCLFNTGTSYQFLNRYEQSIAAYLEGRAIFSRQQNEIFTAKADDILQTLYQKLRRYDKAMELGEEAIRLSRKNNLDYELSNALANMAINHIQTHKPSAALPLLKEALTISRSMDNKYLEQSVHLSYSDAFSKLEELENLKTHAQRAVELARELGDQKGEALGLLHLSNYYFLRKDWNSAASHARASLEISRQAGLREELQKNYAWMADLSLATGNLQEYRMHTRAASLLSDSLLNEQIQARIADLEEQYESRAKEDQILLLESRSEAQKMQLVRRSTFNALLIGLTGVLLLASLLLYRNFTQRQALHQRRISELETEKQLMAAEAVLKGEEQERARLAKDLHDSLGGMLSGIKFSFQKMRGNLVLTEENRHDFERSLDMLDSSIREMRRVAHNMMPESLLKYGLDAALKDFCNDINQTGSMQITYQSAGEAISHIDQTRTINIYRIVQELLGNIVRHSGASTAIVQLIRNNDRLFLTVEDDGKGMNAELLKEAKGMGWKNIRSRVEFLQGKIEVDSTFGKGTSVHIDIPVT